MIGELSDEIVHEGQTVKFWPYAHDRSNSGFTVGKKFEKVLIVRVPVSALLEVWKKLTQATRAGKLGYGAEVCVDRDFYGEADPNFRVIQIYLGECKKQEVVKTIEHELLALAPNCELYSREFKLLTRDEFYDKEFLEKVYGKELILSYKKIIRESGLLKGTKDEKWDKAERQVLTVMTSYLSAMPGYDRTRVRLAREEFNEHEKKAAALISRLYEIERNAFELLRTRIRDPIPEEQFRKLTIGQSAPGHTCASCGNVLTVIELDSVKLSARLRCPQSGEENNAGRRHTEDALASFKSGRDGGLFHDLGDMVLESVVGLASKVEAEFLNLKQQLPKQTGQNEYHEAWVAAQLTEIVKKFCSVRDFYARVATFINGWPHWKGGKMSRDTIRKKQALIPIEKRRRGNKPLKK